MSEPPLILIQTGENLGFAGGNNVGIRYALARDHFEYIWLLNNDTVIDKGALYNLVNCMDKDQKIGICGSTLLYYHEPEAVQALGGATYNKWLGISKHIIEIDPQKTEQKMDYVVGASMLVSYKFLKEIGLLCEDYFLYYEEVDWATRAKPKFRLAYAPKSIVYHKEGASIGTNKVAKQRSILADFFIITNKIKYTRKYCKYALLTIYLSIIVTIVNRIRRKQFDRVKLILNIVFNNKDVDGKNG